MNELPHRYAVWINRGATLGNGLVKLSNWFRGDRPSTPYDKRESRLTSWECKLPQNGHPVSRSGEHAGGEVPLMTRPGPSQPSPEINEL